MKTKINDIVVMPVKKYTVPKYPTLADAQCKPLLLKKLPSRWEKNAAVVTAIGILGAVTLTSCGLLEPRNDTGAGYNPGSENFLNVAPVFIHGEGTGSMGCVMIAPAVFMSEEEAFAIIKGEMESAGLNFNAVPPEYIATNNKAKETSQYSWENRKYILGDGNVGLELYDAKKGVGVTFISMEEATETDENGYVTSSVTSYRPRELAELTVEDFGKQKGDISIGVFYDPGKDWEDERQKQILEEYNNSEKEWNEACVQYENDAKLLIEEDLREQVRDFIEWLQGQGII